MLHQAVFYSTCLSVTLLMGEEKLWGLFQALKLNKLAGDKDSHCPCYLLVIILLEALIKTDYHANSHVFS